MEAISVFDMLKIGVGPSSSHTLGPWRAAEQWLAVLEKEQLLKQVISVQVKLYGSLALTGKGHATDIAVALGLMGEDPVTVDCDTIDTKIESLKNTGCISLNGKQLVPFDFDTDIRFNKAFPAFSCQWVNLLSNLSKP